jgi:hypothetical protein
LRDRAALGAPLWPTGDADAQGYEEIEARAASAYEHCVGSEGLSFRGSDDAEPLGDVVKAHWEAVAKDSEAFGVGINFLVLAAYGRIERDYTFVVAEGDEHRFTRRALSFAATLGVCNVHRTSTALRLRVPDSRIACSRPLRARWP